MATSKKVSKKIEKKSVKKPAKPVVKRSVRKTGSLQIASINPPQISGMEACIEDARVSALDDDPGPGEPSQYGALRERLDAARDRLPPVYQEAFATPLLDEINRLGQAGFERLLKRDPNREGQAGLLLDCAQAALQQGEGYAAEATDAFQEVVNDLYDGFLSAEDRQGVKQPDDSVIAPLVKWGNPDFGPYTWPVDATCSLGIGTGVVNLPPSNARIGLAAWSAIAHETAGHDILHADEGLPAELARQIRQQLAPLGYGLSEYWSSRIDETASDVMGVLNMGPAAAIGLIVYFRALNAAWGDGPKLRSEGPSSDPHPADIVRGYLAAEAVSLLKFTGKTIWAKVVAAETDKDLETVVLGDTEINAKLARKSAQIVAETLIEYRATSLEGHALGEIQNWRDTDERKVRRLRQALRAGASIPEQIMTETYAAHAVAAAMVEALSDGSNIAEVFSRMRTILKSMHDANPSWGPLYVRHRGDLARRILYRRQSCECKEE